MKKSIIVLSLFLFSCKKVFVAPVEVKTNSTEFFTNPVNDVSNGDPINFSLQKSGYYTLTMIDTVQNQVVTREKFAGKIGSNTLNIYTKTITQTYLSVILTDDNNNQVGKTKITIK
jgi:hypothetical protein